MKAVMCKGYGSPDVIEICEVSKPKLKDYDVLVKVYYSSVQAADWRIRSMDMPKGMGFLSKLVFGFSKPKLPILGTEASGKIVEVGAKVSKFKIGDEVIALPGMKMGAHAEYLSISENGIIIKKPDFISFKEAAVISFGGITAYDYLINKTKVGEGNTVLINGASGPVGLALIQLAKNLGAHVTAVCGSNNFPLVKSLGANEVIDYKAQDFRTNNKKYNVIIDVIGLLTFKNSKNSLTKNGKLVLITTGLFEMLKPLITNLYRNQKVIVGVAVESLDILNQLLEKYSKGKFKVIIDKEYNINDAKRAHAYIEKRHRSGNILLKVSDVLE